MLKEATITFELGPAARLHLPWQGCWQVEAGRLSEPVELQGVHLPLLVWEERGRWSGGHLRFGDDDAILFLTLRWRAGRLELILKGDWASEPSVETAECGDRDATLAWARRMLGLPKPSAAPTRFARMFILDIHDPRGNLIQRFDDVRGFVNQSADLGLADGSLYYLAGWDGPFDGTYPDYVPAANAGGAEAMARLIEAARSHGGEVMPHTNHWGLSRARTASYPQLEPHILRDSAGEKAGWPGALWCGATNPLWYVNPTSEPWLAHFNERLAALKRLGVKVVMLDQVAPPLGENWRANFRRFVAAVRSAHPDLVLVSESVNHDLLADMPVAELWGPVWTAMPELAMLEPSPWMADVLAGAVQLIGHIGMPAPYPTLCAWTHYVYVVQHGHERACRASWDLHAKSGVLPTLRIVATRYAENERALRDYFREPARSPRQA